MSNASELLLSHKCVDNPMTISDRCMSGVYPGEPGGGGEVEAQLPAPGGEGRARAVSIHVHARRLQVPHGGQLHHERTQEVA